VGIKIETISAITVKVVCMETAVEFYRGVHGMKLLYGGPGFEPERPQDASWGERHFHMRDTGGHELSFARRLQAPA
jgi:catechol 2,3-dioxygenase-like lactoylglutathione lyase family enzyme